LDQQSRVFFGLFEERRDEEAQQGRFSNSKGQGIKTPKYDAWNYYFYFYFKGVAIF
jgi:hypothetical protein